MGTLIHAVLEHLFDAPAPERIDAHAQDLLSQQWAALKSKDPQVLELFVDQEDQSQWESQMRTILSQYFAIEDPKRLEPHSREQLIDAVTNEGIRLRGFIDRVDCAPNGALRVVDYKTGKAPSPRFQEEALFQMRFYALLLQLVDRLPARTQLIYLKAGQVLTLDPQAADIEAFRVQLSQLWSRIEADAVKGEFAPRKNPLCNWCGVRSMCPLFGGTTPELDQERIQWLLQTRVA